MLRPLLFRLAEDRLIAALILLFPVLWWIAPLPAAELLPLIQWQTIAILAGLLLLSRGLEDSGYLSRAGQWLLMRLRSQRRLALVLVAFSAALSMLVTNDVTLFIVVPLTLALRGVAGLPVGRLVVFEALAVNAGSAISPIGNPQNLFLWQVSNTGFLEFTRMMLPVGLVLLLPILLAIPLAFRGHALPGAVNTVPVPVRPGLFWCSLLLYPPLLVSAELGLAHLLLTLLLPLYLWRERHVVFAMDWLLLLMFTLMFLDLGLLARLPAMAGLGDWIGQGQSGTLSAGVLLSQIMSNVPAAIFLAGLDLEWRALAWGVSIGGFGVAAGSMANLIALRMAREPGLWREFHHWSVPLLLLGWLAGLALYPLGP